MKRIFLLTLVLVSCQMSKPVPVTEKRPVTDEYHGVRITDDYRWLERAEDPDVQKWIEAQNDYSRAYFERLSIRSAVHERLSQLSVRPARYYRLTPVGDRVFAMKDQPPRNRPVLVVLPYDLDTSRVRVVVDPEQLDSNARLGLDWFRVSDDGRFVAVSLSARGSEDGSARVFEVATGRQLDDVVPRVQFPTGGGDLAWNHDGSGFWYTRYPQGNERPDEDRNFYQQVYFHRLGTPASEDRYVFGRELPRIAEIRLATADRHLIASVQNGDGGEYAHYVMNPSGVWTQVTQFSDGVTKAEAGPDGQLYLLSHKEAPTRQLLSVSLRDPKLSKARIIVQAGEPVIDDFAVARDRLFVVDMYGGPNRIRVLSLKGQQIGIVPVAAVSSISNVVAREDGTLLYRMESYIQPPAIFRYDARDKETIKVVMGTSSPAKFDDSEVIREFATSKDGTKIPINILRLRSTKLDGNNPVILYGYGGYGLSQRPRFSDKLRLWIENGGVWVDANLRGGGEFGKAWHLAGNLTRKQNVFDDFIACAEYLITQKYTNPSKLAIMGGSNGGLLMGAAMTQRPDLFRAVVSRVGIYDMLRVELSPNGAFNVTEFGTVKDPDQFKALHGYSPLHRVEDGTTYPAVYMSTGDHDGRVDPMQSRKMIARLQATGSARPMLLRTNATAGHGPGTSMKDRLEEDTNVYSFLMEELGVHFKSTAK